ncbi:MULTISPECIES: hypothetical protein [Okeania]|nr:MULTISPECIES: hypothetical protein [Okeania]NES91695.1 hypothetical protein [Okeania sp. SIO2B9]NET22003.1 hypothetical protein [Okeania sp. SIO1H5]NET78788.1 hypothetical protein [Okeania sp. SIO1F9]NET95417.1 hypothetical protein [Okeania sp. SIO1H2]
MKLPYRVRDYDDVVHQYEKRCKQARCVVHLLDMIVYVDNVLYHFDKYLV